MTRWLVPLYFIRSLVPRRKVHFSALYDWSEYERTGNLVTRLLIHGVVETNVVSDCKLNYQDS